MFEDAADVNGPGGAAVELHCPFHVCVEGFDHVLLDGQPAANSYSQQQTATASSKQLQSAANSYSQQQIATVSSK